MMDPLVKHLDGIYSDERVMQFFIALKAIGDSCFRTLYDLAREKSHSVQSKGDTRSMLGRSLKRTVCVGLDYVNGWDDSIKDQEVMQAKKQVPTIEMDYKYTLVQYLKQLHRHKSSHMRMKIPSFGHFLYSFLRRMANSEELRELQYFSSSFADKDVFMRELLRQTLGQDCAPQAILLEEAPMAKGGGSGNSCTSSASSSQMMAGQDHHHEASSTRGVSLPVTPATPNPIGDVPWEQQSYLKQEVTPDDSISNVPRPCRRSSRSSSASKTGSLLKGLTTGILERHMQRYTTGTPTSNAADAQNANASPMLHGGPLPPSEQRAFQSQMKSIPIGGGGTGIPPTPVEPLPPPVEQVPVLSAPPLEPGHHMDPVAPFQPPLPTIQDVSSSTRRAGQQQPPSALAPLPAIDEPPSSLRPGQVNLSPPAAIQEPSFVWPHHGGDDNNDDDDAHSQMSAHPTVLSTFPVLALHSQGST